MGHLRMICFKVFPTIYLPKRRFKNLWWFNFLILGMVFAGEGSPPGHSIGVSFSPCFCYTISLLYVVYVLLLSSSSLLFIIIYIYVLHYYSC